jgi:peptidoglycan/xylan/chitin deacetylase (PgdA/CDA1 family)
MLHTRDNRQGFLPPLLERLQGAGIQSITYKAWRQRALNRMLTDDNLVMLVVDDLSMAQGNPSFEAFERMCGWFREAQMPAVFAIITAHDQPQVAGRWDTVAGWAAEGFELATHTAYHSNLNAEDTTPRGDFRAANYRFEITDSARFIEEQVRARGLLHYTVSTLVTPYGSGYAYQQPQPALHAPVVEACRAASIRMVVGIVQGRDPLPLAALRDDVVYLGRTPPGYRHDEDGALLPDTGITFRYLDDWRQVNLHRRRQV